MHISRSFKQVIIFSVYCLLAMLLGIIIYYAFLKAPVSCVDGKQNQNETGIDCGGICQAVCQEIVPGVDLVIQEITFLPAGNGLYDVLAKVYNPNDEVGASSFEYTISLKDSAGVTLITRSDRGYILPQESKYIISLNFAATSLPVAASLQIENVQWERFTGYQTKPTINIYQKRYNQISSGVGFSEVYGLLSNESQFDFRSIVVKVILRDAENRALAFNTTEMRTVKSHEERDFRLVWPNSFPGTVEKVETEVDADVYHSDNFMRQYLPEGRYQEFAPPGAY